MPPVSARYERGEFIVVQRCRHCGRHWQNRAAAGDSTDALIDVMATFSVNPVTIPSPRRRT
jgi:hypothetical protein